ncbi:efflux RND transporter permease subunit, partial [Pseudomonas sp. 79_C]|uniref:efflux RND transporter permease subunit n=1 Tax=Pseudomonas sp. 79_C TaxID=2813567 RepID=UPI001A9EB2E8
RNVTASEVIDRLQPQVDRLVGIRLFMQPVQDLSIEDRVSRTQYQFSLSSPDAELLAQWSGKLVQALQQRPELADVASDLQDKGLQVYLVIDRDMASRLGISVSQITNALYDAFGQRQISTIYTQASQYRVVLQSKDAAVIGPQALAEGIVQGVG